MIAPGFRSFYQPGGALPLDSPAYVVRRADEELFAFLMRGDYCSILTSRQMGKSSLIARTSVRLRAEGVVSCIIDLSGMSDTVSAPDKWYFSLALKIGKALKRDPRQVAAMWSSDEGPSPAQRWIGCIEQMLAERASASGSFRLVVFLDEIDATRDMTFKDGFFAVIRSCHNRRPTDPDFQRLTFCLVGSARPTDLIADPHLTPFNIGRRIELSDFTEEEAQALVPGMERAEMEGKALMRRVLYWTGGHPYLTHRLCMQIAESDRVREPGDVDGLTRTLFFTSESREQDDNLAFVSHRALTSCDSERDVTRLLSTYDEVLRGRGAPDQKSDAVLSVLHLAGLVRSEGGRLALRNRIYAHVFDRAWVREHMPDAPARAIRAARLRSAFRWAGLSAAMGVLALYAVMQRRIALHHEAVARRLAYAEHVILMQSMQALWEHSDLSQIQANLRNTPESERNFEWRYWLRETNQSLRTLEDPAARGERVAAAVFAPDGSWLATAGKFPFIDVWDPSTGALIKRLPERTCPYTLSLDVSPDGRRLVSGGDGGVAKIWDATTWQPVANLGTGGPKDEVTCVRFSPDGRLVAAGSVEFSGKGITRIYDAKSGTPCHTFDTGNPYGVAFSPTAPVLAVGGVGNRISLWPIDREASRPLAALVGPNRRLSCVTYSADGRELVSGSKDNSIRVWSIGRREIERTLAGSDNGVSSIAFATGGDRVFGVGLDRALRAWDIHSAEQIWMVPAHTRWVNSVAVSPRGLIATASDDGTIKLWTPPEPRELRADLRGVTGIGRAICVGDSWRLPAFGGFGQVGWLDIPARAWHSLDLPPPASPLVAFGASVDGRVFVRVDAGGGVESWAADGTRRLLRRVVLPVELTNRLTSVAFSPACDRMLLAQLPGRVAWVDLRSGTWRSVFSDPDSQDPSVVWAPGVRPIWSAGPVGDRTLYISDPAFSRPPRRVSVPTAGGMHLSRDARMLLITCVTSDHDPDPTLIDLATMSPRRLVGHATSCQSADFSPDGSRLVTGGADDTVRLWDVRDGVNLQTWHMGFNPTVLFSPEGDDIVVTYGEEIRILKAATPSEVRRWTAGWPTPD